MGIGGGVGGEGWGGFDLNKIYARMKFSNDNSDDDNDNDDATSGALPRHTSGCESVSWGHCPVGWGPRLNQKGLKESAS